MLQNISHNNNTYVDESQRGTIVTRIKSASIKTTLDKEKLYEENLQLKHELNKIKSQYAVTKKENYIMEQEMKKKDKALEEMAIDTQHSMMNNISHNYDYYNQSKLLNKATEV
jgi:hypothetical protein